MLRRRIRSACSHVMDCQSVTWLVLDDISSPDINSTISATSIYDPHSLTLPEQEDICQVPSASQYRIPTLPRSHFTTTRSPKLAFHSQWVHELSMHNCKSVHIYFEYIYIYEVPPQIKSPCIIKSIRIEI